MKEVDFIIWMCEKAGTKYRLAEGLCIYVHKGVCWSIKTSLFKSTIYPLLVQNTFKYFVRSGEIYHDVSWICDRLLNESKMEDWLKYIYNQETNNE